MGDASVLTRQRVYALAVGILLLGSPPVQSSLPSSPSSLSGFALRYLGQVLSVPQWWPADAGSSFWLNQDGTGTALVLVAGIVWVVPRVVPRVEAGRVRWITAIGTGVVIGALAAIAAWGLHAVHGDPLPEDPATAAGFLLYALDPCLAFGLLLGTAIGAVFDGLDTLPLPPPLRRAARTLVRGTTASRASEGSAPTRRGRVPRSREGSSTMSAEPEPGDPTAIGSTPGDVTRYLCAASYTDPVFARRVVEVLSDEFGAVAPSPGVDLVPVVRHALAARRLHHHRDAWLAAAAAALALAGPFWLLYAVVALKLLALGTRVRRKPDQRSASVHAAPARRSLYAAAGVVLLASYLRQTFTAWRPSGPWVWVLGSYGQGLPALAVLFAALAVVYGATAHQVFRIDARLRTSLRRETFRPDARPDSGHAGPAASWATGRLAALEAAQRGNVTVYSGFAPFVGHGVTVSAWTLTIPILPAARLGGRPGAVADFDAWDILVRLRERLTATADHGADRLPPQGRGPGLRGLVVEDRVFVNGAALSGDERRLTGQDAAPRTRLTEEELRRAVLHPDGAARHYLAAQLPLWGGDVVPSMFLHVSSTGRTLHVQCETHALGPVRPAYHQVDSLPDEPTGMRRGTLLLTALRQAAGLFPKAPAALLEQSLFEGRRHRRALRDRRLVERDPRFDLGARVSIRELAMGPEYQNYFQLVDADRALAQLDRHALAAIRDFLEEHGVDTTEFRSQQQTILNHGIIQQGGVSVVGNQAVGQGARATAGQAPPAPAHHIRPGTP